MVATLIVVVPDTNASVKPKSLFTGSCQLSTYDP